jgi:hypothetical protein
LDYEAKQRQLFESPPNQQQTTTTTAGGVNPSSQPYTRQTTDAFLKIKRQSSSSTFLSDSKAQ